MRAAWFALCLLIAAPVSADTIYSTDFLDPTTNGPLGPGTTWFDGTPLGTVIATATFIAPTDALITELGFWIYDTTDGAAPQFGALAYTLIDLTLATLEAVTMTVATDPTWETLTGHRTFGDISFYTMFVSATLAPDTVLIADHQYELRFSVANTSSGPSSNARWAFAADGNGGAFLLDGTTLVPEPSTLLLSLMGLLVIVFHTRRCPKRHPADAPCQCSH